MNDTLKHALRNRRRRQRPDIGVAEVRVGRAAFGNLLGATPDIGVAEVRVGRAAFGNLLGAMREWLDRNERRPTHFETEVDDGGVITIKVRFDDDDLTEIFRQAFAGSDGVDHRAGARQENQQEQRSPLIP